VEGWIKILAEEADRRWEQGTPLLLSQIPAVLTAANIDPASVQSGRQLLLALKADAAEVLTFFQHPENKAVWAAVTREKAAGHTAESAFKRMAKSKAIAEPKEYAETKRFIVWFWSAFIKELELGKTRWILEGRFLDRIGEARPEGAVAEVDRSEIAYPGPQTTANSREVVEKIEAWSRRTGISIDVYTVQGSQREPDVRSKTILDLSKLSSIDLQRIFIPLDIVLKLI